MEPARDQTILITGGTSGIGRATARALAGQGARVVIVGRDLPRTRAAVDWIRRETGNPRVDLLLADLEVPRDVRDLALAFGRGHDHLDVLINNAGGFFSEYQVGAGGFERTWALNHLAYVGLTLELLPLLRNAAAGRIVNVSSSLHRRGRIDFNDSQGTVAFDGVRAYAQSKLANVMFTQLLARRLARTRVTVNALHPGLISSGLGRNMHGPTKLFYDVLARPFRRSAERGAETPVYLASAPEVEGVTGAYFVNCRPTQVARAAGDGDVQERLWRVSLEQLGRSDDIDTGGARTGGSLLARGGSR
jgi:retinol dehydrogenase-12